MTVNFYQISDDRRVLDKDISSAGKLKRTVTAVIKADSDIMQPVMEVTYFSELPACNYMYISEWGRYYFISDMSVGAQRCFITGSIDVLMSHKSDILDMYGLVNRTEQTNLADCYLNDPFFKADQYTQNMIVGEFPNQLFTKEGSYVLAVAGPRNF